MLANVARRADAGAGGGDGAGHAGGALVIYLSAPGFGGDGDKFALTVTLLRITFSVYLADFAGLAGQQRAEHLAAVSIPAFTPPC